MRGEILGLERRHRWSDDEKLSIVLSVGTDGATATRVAQRHEITRQQIYDWRHTLKRKGLWGGLLLLDGPEGRTSSIPLGQVRGYGTAWTFVVRRSKRLSADDLSLIHI